MMSVQSRVRSVQSVVLENVFLISGNGIDTI